MPNDKLRAIIYIRISDPKQKGNESLKTQLIDCEAYAEAIGANVAQVFTEECESAKTSDRTELLNLLTFAKNNKGKVDVLIVWKVDRFARNKLDHYALKAKLLSYGIQLHSATEPIDDSPMGKAMEGMLAVFAEFDNDIRSERSLQNMKTAFKEGRWMWRPPLGYLNKEHDRTVGEKAETIPDPERFDLIRKGLKEYGKGYLTPKGLADLYNSWGLTTIEGNEIKPNWVARTIRDKFYAGVMVAKKWDLEQEGKHEPMITIEEFDKNLNLLDGKTEHLKVSKSKHNPLFPLGLGGLKCIECGSDMQHSHPRGKVKRYKYYECRNKVCDLYRKSANNNADIIHEAFENKLQSISADQNVIELFKEVVLDVWNQQHKDINDRNERLEDQIEALRKEKKDIYELAKKNIFNADTIKEDLDSVENKILALKAELNDSRIDEYELESILNTSVQLLQNPLKLWKRSTVEDKKVLQRLIFPEGFTYTPEIGVGTPSLSLPFAVLNEKINLVTPPSHRWNSNDYLLV